MNNHHSIVYVPVNAGEKYPDESGKYFTIHDNGRKEVKDFLDGDGINSINPQFLFLTSVEENETSWLKPLKDVFIFTKEELDEMKKLLDLVVANGGKIISSNDCTKMQIAEARACGRMYVDNDGMGFIYFPPEK